MTNNMEIQREREKVFWGGVINRVSGCSSSIREKVEGNLDSVCLCVNVINNE